MRPRWSSPVRLTILLAVAAGLPHAARAAALPRLDHVLVVVMENHSYDETRVAPYTASLIANASSFSNSHAVTHPSEPNYNVMWSGVFQPEPADGCPALGSPYTSENLGHACEAAGLRWRAYSENLPGPGDPVCSADGALYTRKHDPWTNWSNLDHANERPFSDLAADVANDSLPALAYVIPNNCHNTHDCSVATGDAWLAANVPGLLNAIGPRGLLVVTWDEDDSQGANQILTLFAGDLVRPNYVSPTLITHFTVLRTLCDVLGLAPIGLAAAESSITDVWVEPTRGVQASWGKLKMLYR